MGRCDNLKPFNTLPPEQQRAISSKGGKASGAARRAKRQRIEEQKARAIAEKEMHDNRFRELREDIRAIKQLTRILR